MLPHPSFSVLLSAVLVLLAGCMSQPSSETEPPAGLHRVSSSGLDAVFMATNADFHSYHAIYIEPLTIHYDPAPRRDSLQRRSDAFQLTDPQRAYLQTQYEQAVLAAWRSWPGWQLVDQPAPGVITLRTELQDFYLYAPLQDKEPTPTRTLIGESSRFTLIAKLIDSETETVLLESRDRRVTGERNSRVERMRPFSAVRYWSDFYQNIMSWAGQLGRTLESSAE